MTTAVYGGTLLAVDGNYDDANRLATELAAEHEDWAFVNVNVRPYNAQGSKTLGYEVAEELRWRLPEQIVVPVASGSQLTKVDKGFTEFGKLGLVEPTPYKVFGAQATGCSPVAQAFAEGHDVIRPVRPDTIARSLAIGNPADGPYVLDAVRRTGGAVADVSDAEVVEGIRLLAATEGVFAETAGGVTVATTRKLVESGRLDPDAETVILITGDGLKTLDAVSDQVGPRRHGAEHDRPCAKPCGSGPLVGGGRRADAAGGDQSPPPGPAPPRRDDPAKSAGLVAARDGVAEHHDGDRAGEHPEHRAEQEGTSPHPGHARCVVQHENDTMGSRRSEDHRQQPAAVQPRPHPGEARPVLVAATSGPPTHRTSPWQPARRAPCR